MNDSQKWHDFVSYAATKLEQNLTQIRRCANLLNEEELWRRDNSHVNSVGNLLLHLTGNVRQWIVAGIGGEPFERDRPAEFAARGPLPREPLMAHLDQTVTAAIGIIRALPADRAATPHTIQGYNTTTQIAIFHVVEHFSFHTGQIVHATKLIRDIDLSLYDEQGHKRAETTARGEPQP